MTHNSNIGLIIPSDKSLEWKKRTGFLVTSLELIISQLGFGKPKIELFTFSEFKSHSIDYKVVIIGHDILDSSLKELEQLNNEINCYVVLYSFISITQLPLTLQTSNCYTFFDTDSETGYTRNYNPFGSSTEQRLYWAKVLDLAFDLGNKIFLNEIIASFKQSVYLAQTNPEQYESRDAIRSELVHRGFNVYPNHMLAGSASKIAEQVSEYLEKCSMSVHIISSTYGQVPEGGDSSLVELQCRLAAKRWRLASQNKNNNEFQRIVWLAPGIKPADEKQRQFISSLRIEDKNDSSEIVQTPLEELKTVLREKLDAIVNAVIEETPTVEQQSIYLVHEKKDSAHVQEISKLLCEKFHSVYNIDFNKTTSQVVTKHYQLLSKANAVIICDFNSNKQWVNSKLKDLIKAPGFGRITPFKVQAVLTKQPDRYVNFNEGNSNMVLNANLNLEEALEPFLTKITQA